MPQDGRKNGTYTYKGTTYKKEDGVWLKGVNNKFVPLTKGDVNQRINTLNKNAKPVSLNGYINIDRVGHNDMVNIDTTGFAEGNDKYPYTWNRNKGSVFNPHEKITSGETDRKTVKEMMDKNNIKYADGGQLTQFNEGGTHEENPLGGIPQGQGPSGQPNLVEEGETKLDSANYIFSDRLKLDKEVAEDLNIEKKYIGKTFADISKKLSTSDSFREGDTIEDSNSKRNLDNLMNAQEEFKKRDLAKDLMMMQEKHPEFMAQMSQPQEQEPQQPSQEEMMAQQQMQQGQPPMDPSMMQQQGGVPPMPQMQAYGGSMYADGGDLNNQKNPTMEAYLSQPVDNSWKKEFGKYVQRYNDGTLGENEPVYQTIQNGQLVEDSYFNSDGTRRKNFQRTPPTQVVYAEGGPLGGPGDKDKKKSQSMLSEEIEKNRNWKIKNGYVTKDGKDYIVPEGKTWRDVENQSETEYLEFLHSKDLFNTISSPGLLNFKGRTESMLLNMPKKTKGTTEMTREELLKMYPNSKKLKQYADGGYMNGGPGDKDKKKKGETETTKGKYDDWNWGKSDPVPRPVTQDYQKTKTYQEGTAMTRNALDYEHNNNLMFNAESESWSPYNNKTDAAWQNTAGFDNFVVDENASKTAGQRKSARSPFTIYDKDGGANRVGYYPAEVLQTRRYSNVVVPPQPADGFAEGGYMSGGPGDPPYANAPSGFRPQKFANDDAAYAAMLEERDNIAFRLKAQNQPKSYYDENMGDLRKMDQMMMRNYPDRTNQYHKERAPQKPIAFQGGGYLQPNMFLGGGGLEVNGQNQMYRGQVDLDKQNELEGQKNDDSINSAISQVPVVGGVVAGVKSVIDPIAEGMKDGFEKTNKDGTFVNKKKVEAGYGVGTIIDPIQTATRAWSSDTASTGEKVVAGFNLLLPGLSNMFSKSYVKDEENKHKREAGDFGNSEEQIAASQEALKNTDYAARGGYLKSRSYAPGGYLDFELPNSQTMAYLESQKPQNIDLNNVGNTGNYADYQNVDQIKSYGDNSYTASPYTKDADGNTFGDPTLGDGKTNFDTKQTIGDLMTYAPVAYNFMQGAFGKADKKDLNDYYKRVEAYKLNIDPELRSIEQTSAAGQNAIRNAGTGASYLGAMGDQSRMRNEALSQAHNRKQMFDINQKQQSERENNQNKIAARTLVTDYNAKSEAAKRGYTEEAYKQMGDIGTSNTQNRLDAQYNSMMSPDFSANYVKYGEQFQNWLKDQNEKKQTKRKTSKK